MRKWFCLTLLTITAGGLGGYWLCSKPIPSNPVTIRPITTNKAEKHDGDAESSDAIEPLVVERVGGAATIQLIPLAAEDGLHRVVLLPGTVQPPRPDAEQGKTPRMPYADEEEILAAPLDPVARILDATRPALNVFEGINLEPEESEPTAEQPSSDYHRMHPHCPFPYYRR